MGVLKVWDGSAWIEVPIVSDHGQLTGLSDDDHPQYIKKARGTYPFGKRNNQTDDFYMDYPGSTGGTGVRGYVMPRAGSVLSCSMSFNVNAIEMTYDGTGSITIEVRVNDVVVFTGTVAVPASTSVERSGFAIQDTGIDTFAAGDKVSLSALFVDDPSGDSFTINGAVGHFEVDFDT